MRKIKAAGIEVGAWTANDRATMRRLLEMGVERIYTDQPRLLLQLKSPHEFQNVECEGNTLGRYEFDCSLGIVELSNGQLLSASGRCEQEKGCSGNTPVVVPDDASGLRFLQQPNHARDD